MKAIEKALERMIEKALGEVTAEETQHQFCPWEIGEYYLIRTVTMIDTGKVVAVTPHEIVLEDAAWIADTGRFSDSLKDPSLFNEVEPYPDGRVLIGRGSMIEAVRIKKFNRSQK